VVEIVDYVGRVDILGGNAEREDLLDSNMDSLSENSVRCWII
jgi:hypothetical protein